MEDLQPLHQVQTRDVLREIVKFRISDGRYLSWFCILYFDCRLYNNGAIYYLFMVCTHSQHSCYSSQLISFCSFFIILFVMVLHVQSNSCFVTHWGPMTEGLNQAYQDVIENPVVVILASFKVSRIDGIAMIIN